MSGLFSDDERCQNPGPYTDALAELVETRWRRDALPNPICRCGCSVLAHRTDLKKQACQTGGCTCAEYSHAWNDWAERRTVREAVA